jgi:transcriptional regulator with XRE-family HTH domain
MVAINEPPNQIIRSIAQRSRERRLELELTQVGLARRAGVSLGTLKKFEHTGQISLESLLKLAVVLDNLEDFTTLFQKRNEIYQSLDELLKKKHQRKRGRIK